MQMLAIDLSLGLEKLLLIGGIISFSLLVAMYTTYGERKIAAWMQDRRGPNRAGPFGLLQPAADGLKLFFQGGNHTSHLQQVTFCTRSCACNDYCNADQCSHSMGTNH